MGFFVLLTNFLMLVIFKKVYIITVLLGIGEVLLNFFMLIGYNDNNHRWYLNLIAMVVLVCYCMVIGFEQRRGDTIQQFDHNFLYEDKFSANISNFFYIKRILGPAFHTYCVLIYHKLKKETLAIVKEAEVLESWDKPKENNIEVIPPTHLEVNKNNEFNYHLDPNDPNNKNHSKRPSKFANQ